MCPVVEDLGFSQFHRRDVFENPEIVDRTFIPVDEQMPNTQQELPDLSLDDDLIDTLGVNKLITGTLKSQQITLDVTATEGDVYIGAGTFDASAWTCTGGFLLGIDDGDSDKEKFFIGDATTSLDWNVTTADTLTIVGTITATAGNIGGFTITSTSLTGGIIQTDAAANTGIKMSSTNLLGYDANNDQTFDLNASTGNLTLQSITGGGLIDIKGEVKPTLVITAGQAVIADDFVWIKSDGKVYRTDATSATTTDQYLGVAVEGKATDADVQVQLTGFYSGLSGLTIGSVYYLQDQTASIFWTTNTSFQNYSLWRCETFTVGGSNVFITFLEVYLAKTTDNTTVTVGIKAVDGSSKPTGAFLWSDTVTLTSTTLAWKGFYPEYTLTASTEYAIVIHGDESLSHKWGVDEAAGYAGTARTSTDGTTWGNDQAIDYNFRISIGAGTIGTSAGSNSKKVGLATSATDLLLLNS